MGSQPLGQVLNVIDRSQAAANHLRAHSVSAHQYAAEAAEPEPSAACRRPAVGQTDARVQLLPRGIF